MARMLVLSLLFFPALSPALEIYQNSVRDKNSWTFLYGENGVWIADSISLDKNGWPAVASKKISPTRPALKNPISRAPFQDVQLKNQNGASLWTVTNQWDWNWELKYTDWVKAEFHAGWWRQNNIATDCADVVYSARWVFARIHGLPMANHLITGHVFTHESVKAEWEALPTAPDWRNDQRFLAALDYLLSQAFTHTLWQDSYPVAINPASMLPGGYHLYVDHETGHTQFLYQVGTEAEEVPLLTLNSTVPRQLRDMMEWIFSEQYASQNSSGFLRMRWPKFENGSAGFIDPGQMPHYSLEQFDRRFIQGGRHSFWEEVFFRLNPRANFDKIGLKTVQQIVDQFKARVAVVDEGYRICSASPCLKGTAEYEAWSTPSRDKRIADGIKVFDSLSSLIGSWSDITAMMHTPILTYNRRTYKGSDFMSKWRAGLYSSDPNVTPARRWGIRY